MIKDKLTDGYSEEMTLNYSAFLKFIEKVELKHLIRTLNLDPNPSFRVKAKIENTWDEETTNHFTAIVEKYKNNLFLYKFLKSSNKFAIYTAFNKIRDIRIDRVKPDKEDYENAFLNKVMSIKKKTDHFNEREFKELSKVDFKDPFLISELQVYYVATEILNANRMVDNQFVNKYIDFESNTFFRINTIKMKNKIKKDENNSINTLKLSMRMFTTDMYCKDHDNLFCKKCYYNGDLHKTSMLQHYVNEATKADLTEEEREKRKINFKLFNILNNSYTIENSKEYNEIIEEIKQKMRTKLLM